MSATPLSIERICDLYLHPTQASDSEVRAMAREIEFSRRTGSTARVVTTVEELDALPMGTVILLERGVVAMATAVEEDATTPTGWMGIGHDLLWTSAQVVEHTGEGASFTVLYAPEAVSGE